MKKRCDSKSDLLPGRDLMEKSHQNKKKLGECSSREKINDTLNEKLSFEVINKKKNGLETPACSRALKNTLNKRRSFLEEEKSEILMTKVRSSSKSMKKNNNKNKIYEEEEEYKNEKSCSEDNIDSSDFHQKKYNAEIIKKDNFFEKEEKKGSSQMMNNKKKSPSKLMMINSFQNLHEEEERTELRRISHDESRSDGEINEENECDFLEDLSHIMCENGDFPFYHQEKENQRSNDEIESFLELMPAEVSDIEVDCDEDKEEIQALLLSFD